MQAVGKGFPKKRTEETCRDYFIIDFIHTMYRLVIVLNNWLIAYSIIMAVHKLYMYNVQ